MTTTVSLDVVNALELAEILEYFTERLAVLPDHGLATLLFAQCSPYGPDDLRADVTRLINRLYTRPFTP
jgi:hypothetical protein